MALLDDVKEVLVDTFGCCETEIKENSHFVTDLGADSLKIIDLTMAVEEKFGIEIPDEEVEKIGRVETLLAYLETRVA